MQKHFDRQKLLKLVNWLEMKTKIYWFTKCSSVLMNHIILKCKKKTIKQIKKLRQMLMKLYNVFTVNNTKWKQKKLFFIFSGHFILFKQLATGKRNDLAIQIRFCFLSFHFISFSFLSIFSLLFLFSSLFRSSVSLYTTIELWWQPKTNNNHNNDIVCIRHSTAAETIKSNSMKHVVWL